MRLYFVTHVVTHDYISFCFGLFMNIKMKINIIINSHFTMTFFLNPQQLNSKNKTIKIQLEFSLIDVSLIKLYLLTVDLTCEQRIIIMSN